jgi:6-pyruvoyl-tetrahydropterin synthase
MIVTASFTISMGHRLPSYSGICSSPHGHNVRVSAWVQLQLGQFLDFKSVKGALRETLEDFDHAMVLQNTDPLVEALKPFGFRTVLLDKEPTTENIAAYVFWKLVEKVQADGQSRVVRVIVEETDSYSAICESIPLFEVRRVL